MNMLRELKDKFLKCEEEYLKFKTVCNDTTVTMQEDLKSMFEKSEAILDKQEKTKTKLDQYKKAKGEVNPAKFVELNNKNKVMLDTLY